MRWALLLQATDVNIVHRPGKENCDADCLSRLVTDLQDLKIKDEPSTLAPGLNICSIKAIGDKALNFDVEKAQKEDDFCKYLSTCFKSSDQVMKKRLPLEYIQLNGVWYVRFSKDKEGPVHLLYVPSRLRQALLDSQHATAHSGPKEMVKDLRQK